MRNHEMDFDDELRLIVTEDQDRMRLDRCLAELDEEHSRSFFQKLIEQGEVYLNGKNVKAKDQVKTGDEVYVCLPPVKELVAEPENIPLDILYEDEDLLVVNKGKGMVVHPAPGHPSGTLVNAVLFHCGGQLSGINGILRPGIVHRIDQDTTGAIVVCKNDMSHHALAEQLAVHSITRRYHAIVQGGFASDEGTVDKPIGRNPADRKKMAVNEKNGRRAVTHYRVLQRFSGATYVECSLETGRTHQIRVHMASIGHPLLGDLVYGSGKNPYHLQGQALHAKILGFIHPGTGKYMEFDAPLPDYFVELLEKLA